MKKVKLILATMALSAIMSFVSIAGQWKQDQTGWWYQNDDGSYFTNQWQNIEGKQYYFGADGYVLVNAITPDGKLVDENGLLVAYNNGSYQSILEYYSAKIRAMTPGLIAEYKSEATNNISGLMGLADIWGNKVSNLADIWGEGVSEMADFYFKSGSGKYSEYEDWAGKLYDIYMGESSKIYDAYIDSAL